MNLHVGVWGVNFCVDQNKKHKKRKEKMKGVVLVGLAVLLFATTVLCASECSEPLLTDSNYCKVTKYSLKF